MSALQKFGIGRLAALIGVGAGVTAALIAIVLMMGRQPEALLYSNLDLAEAASVTQALDQAGVKYSVKGDGSTIMVPRDEVASTRLLVAGKGLVTAGSIGYEIFDSTNVLGQTDFVQQLNRQRAMEGELARTIRALDGVSSVRVHLNLPKRQLFEEDAEKPSAAVTIGVGARGPSADMVRAVQNLVAGAVPNLQADAVTVIDQHGKTLSEGGDGGLGGKLADDRKSEVEARIAKTVKEMVEGVVGEGKVRVNVSADLNLNRVTLQEERFDPEGQVIRSESTNEQTAEERREDETVGATAAANIPGAPAANGFQALGSNSRSGDSVTNYEISKTLRTEVIEPGQLRKISVAVAVDGVTAPAGPNGEPGAYTPRSAEEMQRIQELVRAAVGYDQTRGDQMNVVNVRFARDPGEGVSAATPLAGFDKNDIMRAVELGVLALVAALIIFFVIRPMMKPKTLSPAQQLAAIAADGSTPMVTRLVTLPDGGTQMVQVPAEDDSLALPAPQSDFDQRIDIAKIEGQVKASSIKRVSEFVEKHPEESVAILRSWLHETT